MNNIGGSDQLFFLKLSRMGNKIIWNKNAIVFENTSKKKLDNKWFCRRNLRYGYSGCYILKTIYGKYLGTILTIGKMLYYITMMAFELLFFYKKKSFFKIKMYLFRSIGIIKFLLGKKILHYY